MRTAASITALALLSAVAVFLAPAMVPPFDAPGGARTSTDTSAMPMGWHRVGTCTSSDQPTATDRHSVQVTLDRLREQGVNLILEPAAADGRIMARSATRDWHNWVGYSYVDADGQRRSHGHPRPGAYVDGLRWLLDAAYNGGDRPIRVLVAVDRFIVPGYDGTPFGGSELLTCARYADVVEQERRMNPRASIPTVDCPEASKRLEFWKWNVRYVVEALRGHPAVFGWYLWDEPEGITYRHLFGLSESTRPSKYAGASSLPTTDLLRHAAEFVRDMDPAGRPTVVDIHSPHVFFSNRFRWAERERNPAYSSGPFDIRPDGSAGSPVDLLGLEASGNLSHTGARGEIDRLAWYWDPNYLSRSSDMLAEASSRYGLAAPIVIAGQAQLPSHGPYRVAGDLPCGPNDQTRTRLLGDEDLLWQVLTPLINGLEGYIFYSYGLMPADGPGADQVARSNRLIDQLRRSGLARTIRAGRGDDLLTFDRVHVRRLTNYFRADFLEDAGLKRTQAATSPFSASRTLPAQEYTVGRLGRQGDEMGYGQATFDPPPDIFESHRLLRARMVDGKDYRYLFLSNAFDAEITASASVRSGSILLGMEEAKFDLNPHGTLGWRQVEIAPGSKRVDVELGPYEARVFRLIAED